jgi:predicted protein tyrosine phosphatase
MKILVYGKLQFNRFMLYNNITDDNVETKDMFFVSINNPYDPEIFLSKGDVYSHFKQQHSNVLVMHFPDFGETMIENYTKMGVKPFHIFNEHKAKKIYEFIKRNKDKSLAVLHCGAGISRSGAVGAFIFDLYGDMTYEEFKRKNPQIQPNQHILKLLRKEYDKDDTNK